MSETTNAKSGDYEVHSENYNGKVSIKVIPMKGSAPSADPFIDYKREDNGTFSIEIDANKKRGQTS